MVKVNSAVSFCGKVCVLLGLVFLSNSLKAQCSLACNGTTQVSLDVNCEALITPQMILNDEATSCPGNTFQVQVMDQYNNIIPTSPLVTSDYCDQTLVVKIIASSGNTCWGEIIVEDKLGPEITSCPTVPVEYACSDFIEFDGPIFTDACSGVVEPILISESVTPIDCDNDYIKQVVRTYTAVDNKGNYAPECTVTYLLRRIDLGPIGDPFPGCPQSYTVVGNNALDCGGDFKPGQTGGLILDTDTDADGILDADLVWDDNGNGYPDVEEFEGPSLNGVPLYPNPDFYCNSGVFYDDLELPTIGCITKIMRTWYIREWWCGDEIEKTCIQIFEINDDEAPVLECTGPIIVTTNVTTNPHDSFYGTVTCGAEVTFPLPPATDNCSSILTYDLDYPGGFVSNYQPGSYISLPMGENVVTVTVYDECYNSSSCPILVNVVDNTPPVAICDEFTVVSLTNNGSAHVFAETFDDGSYDDCHLKKMLVRRMDPSNCDCTYPKYNDMEYLGQYNDANHYYVSHYPIQDFMANQMADAMGGFVATMGSDDPDEGPWIQMQAFAAQSDPYLIYRNGELVVVNPGGSVTEPVPGTDYQYIMEVDDPCTFSTYTEFCCADVGTNQLVVFRVVDIYGNYNDCMVTVETQDKLAPAVLCPDDMTVYCDHEFDFGDLDLYFDEATFYGSCEVTPEQTYIDNLSQCNTGSIKRIFTGTNGNGISQSCEQIITFVNPDPFTEDQIVYPEDITDNDGCFDVDNYHPDETGYPTFLGDQCDLVGANYEDQVFVFNNQPENGCFKIIRKWSVIDWCQEDAYGNFVVWHHTQVIKVNNIDGPTLACPDSPITVCTYDPDCSSGEVTLTISATDDCTSDENLHWSYLVDLDCDGTYDDVADVQSGNGSVADASGYYPLGTHCILWTFRDQCGNISTCTQEFTIVNCKAPTPYCINGLAVDLMPMDTDGDGDIDWGMVELWASDFDAGSFHPCGSPVTLSFSSDITETNMIFDCTTLGDQDVEIWATVVLPDGTLIQSYCETFVNVQDNNLACPTGGGGGAGDEGSGTEEGYVIEGRVLTEELAELDKIEVDLEGAGMSPYLTDTEGSYVFPPMPLGGSYIVNPEFDKDHLNGVTTLDLVQIQRHILDLESLSSPYKQIAADVNKDYNISALDLIELRKLILGVNDNFQSNESWVFVDAGYTFSDPTNALSIVYPEVYNINDLQFDMNVDFVGVKVGDVNNSAELSNGSNVESRSLNQTKMYINGAEFIQGQESEISLYATDDMEIYGFQFTLKAEKGLEILDAYSRDLGLSAQHIGFNYLSEGYITVSWNTANINSIEKGTKILTLNANVKSDKNPLSLIDINSDITSAQVYTNNYEIETPVIALDNVQGDEITDTFELYQNSPNPFTGATEIGFNLPEDSKGRFMITDLSGKVLLNIERDFVKGINKLRITREQLNAAGILYYTLETENYNATKRMVVIR